MATREVQYKVCDRCTKEAVITRNYAWFGLRYEIDVCQAHDEKLRNALSSWTDVSRVTTRSLSTTPLAPPPSVDPPRPRTPAPAPPSQLRLTGPELDWRHTIHSLERCTERGIDPEVARRVAQWPTWAVTSPKGPQYEERMSDELLVVCAPATHEIVTVARREAEAVAQ